MRFAVCNEMFEGWQLRDVFREARRIGFEGVELAPFTLSDSPLDIATGERGAIRATAQDTGIEIVGLHWLLAKTEGLHLTGADAVVRKRTSDYLCGLVQLCADVGGKVLVLGSPQQRSLQPGVTPDQAYDNAREALIPVARLLEDLGVILCIEPLGPEETDFLNTADDAWRLAQAIGSPAVKIILDVKAMSTEPLSIESVIARHAAHAGHVHLNDPNRRGPGFGEQDFVPVIAALNRAGYDGYASVEVFDFKPDPVTIAERSFAYLQKCLKESINV